MAPMDNLPAGFACRATRSEFNRALVEMTRSGPLTCSVPDAANGLALTYALCAAMDELRAREAPGSS